MVVFGQVEAIPELKTGELSRLSHVEFADNAAIVDEHVAARFGLRETLDFVSVRAAKLHALVHVLEPSRGPLIEDFIDFLIDDEKRYRFKVGDFVDVTKVNSSAKEALRISG